MRNYILTCDYELYGNGSGDVFKNIIEPTDRLLLAVRPFNARMTFFFEVVEYWKLKEEWEKGNKMGYRTNPAEAMELQIKKAVREGHDVQLHIHPQWINAYHDGKDWHVDLTDWRLSDCSLVKQGKLADFLLKGKNTLEQIIRPVKKDYSCFALRAGGYNAQPSVEILKAIRMSGLKADASVVPGAVEQGSLSVYDYSDTPTDKGYWYCDDVLEYPCQRKTDVIEFPIVALPLRRYRKYLSLNRVKALMRNKKSASTSFNSKLGGERKCSLLAKLSYFMESDYQTWDYCLFSNHLNKYFAKKVRNQDRTVFVLVGHPKSLVSTGAVRHLMKSHGGSRFCTLSDVYSEITSQ